MSTSVVKYLTGDFVWNTVLLLNFAKNEVKAYKANNLLKAFEDIDVNKINENLEGVRKILAVLGEFTRKDDTKVKRSYNKPSSNYDD